MKVNKWTLGLAVAGMVTLPAGVQAEEQANPVLTALSSTTISGYVNTSAHWDLGTGNANPPGYSFNSGKQDGFNLDVVKLSIARPLDEAQWAAGYQVDLLFGPDANALATQSTGSGNDFGIQQAYVSLRAPIGNGVDFKVGVWDTIVGYEVFDAGGNPNYTRSWGYSIEPTTHTGVLGSYQVNDIISFAFGVANTFGPAINDRAFLSIDTDGDGYNDSGKSESYKTYLGSIALTAPEELGFLAGSTLYGGIVNGFSSSEAENKTHLYGGATLSTPIESVTVGLAYDYAGLHDTPASGGGKHAYAVAGYISLQATDKLSFHTRADYLKLSQASVPTTTVGAVTSQAGLAEEIFSLTGTIQYDLWANVLSRLEVRWDQQVGGHPGEAFAGEGTTGVAAGSASSDVGSDKSHVLIAANIIYSF